MSPPLNDDILQNIFDILKEDYDPPFANLALTDSAWRERVNKKRFGMIDLTIYIPESQIQGLVPLLSASVWPPHMRPINHAQLVALDVCHRLWQPDSRGQVDDGSIQAILDMIAQTASACTVPWKNVVVRAGSGWEWKGLDDGLKAALGRFLSCGLIQVVEVAGFIEVPRAFLSVINSPTVKLTYVTTARDDTITADIPLVWQHTRDLHLSGGDSVSWLARSVLPCLTELFISLHTIDDVALCSTVLSMSGRTLEKLTISLSCTAYLAKRGHRFSWPDPSLLPNLKDLRLEINPAFLTAENEADDGLGASQSFTDLEIILPPFVPPRLTVAINIDQWLINTWTIEELVYMFRHDVHNDTLATALRDRFGWWKTNLNVIVSLEYKCRDKTLDEVTAFWRTHMREICADLEDIPGCTVEYPVKIGR